MFILNIIHIRLIEFHSQILTRKTSYPEKGRETTGENITSCFTLRRINQRKFYLFKSGFLVKKINNPLVKKITYEPTFVVVVKHQTRKHMVGLREIYLS